MLFYNTNKNKIDKYELAHDQGCDACPLKNTWKSLRHPQMLPTGTTDEPLIYVVGEAPGSEEDNRGEQFVGQSGRLLRESIELNIDSDIRHKIMFDNVLACRPPNNRTPTEFEMECCRSRLEKNIEQYRPTMVLAYGAVPLKWFIQRDGITSWRGRVMPKSFGSHTFWLSFHLHPSFILRQGGRGADENNVNIDRTYKQTFDRDHRQINTWFDTLSMPVVIKDGYRDNITILDGSNERRQLRILEEKLNSFTGRGKRYDVDIETHGVPNGISPFNSEYCMLSAAVGTYDDTIAFVLDHPRGWRTRRAKRRANELFYEFLMRPGIIKEAHHAKFEMSHLTHKYGPEVVLETKWEDTAGQAVSLDERPGQKGSGGMTSLNNLILINFGFELKAQSNVDIRHLIDEPIPDLLYYNGMDTKWESILSRVQRSKMDSNDKRSTRQRVKTAKALSMMERKGLIVNRRTAKRFGTEYQNIMTEMEKNISSLPEIRTYEEKTGKIFSPSSNEQITYVLKNILNIPQIKMTAKGHYSTDKEVLHRLIDRDVKLAEYIIKHREAAKQKSTYVDSILNLIYPDGLLHSDFQHLFVVTGRLSSNNPNIQNFPSRTNKRARDIIEPPPNHYIVSIDYGQIEARVIASLARDVFFIKSIFEDYDIHMDWAKRVAKKKGILRNMSEEALKKLRKDIKNQLVFPWFYGAQIPSVSVAIDLSEHKTGQLFSDFWYMFQGVKSWQDAMVEIYKREGYVITPFGRKRHHPMSLNECLNTPIQGTAADIVNDAMYELTMIAFEENKPQYQPVMQIHDDLTFYIPKDSFEEDVVFLAEIMTTLLYDWLLVPLSVEVSYGEAWGSQEPFHTYETRDFIEFENPLERRSLT
jgi:uracil-DNA glycosylase family 4